MNHFPFAFSIYLVLLMAFSCHNPIQNDVDTALFRQPDATNTMFQIERTPPSMLHERQKLETPRKLNSKITLKQLRALLKKAQERP